MINSVISEFFSHEGPTVNPQYQPQQNSMNKCQCNLRTKLVGDGCRYCNPQDYIDHLHDAIEQKDTWIGLTADEMEGLYQIATYMDETDYIHMLMMAEEKLKEKNYG